MIHRQSLHDGGPRLRHPVLAYGNSDFLEYYTWFESVQGVLPQRCGDEHLLFPCALPYPEALVTEVVEGGGARRWWAMAFVNTFVAWSNYTVLGCPRSGGAVTSREWTIVVYKTPGLLLIGCLARWRNLLVGI